MLVQEDMQRSIQLTTHLRLILHAVTG